MMKLKEAPVRPLAQCAFCGNVAEVGLQLTPMAVTDVCAEHHAQLARSYRFDVLRRSLPAAERSASRLPADTSSGKAARTRLTTIKREIRELEEAM
jgi:hypothetical protein